MGPWGHATRKPNLHGVSPIFYAAVRRHADPRKHAIPLTGVVAVAAHPLGHFLAVGLRDNSICMLAPTLHRPTVWSR